jgi:hypothetical protein
MYWIIGKLLGLRVEKFDDHAFIKFPIWANEKMRNQICDNFKSDYEVKKNKPIKITLGYRIAKLEYDV